MDVRGRVTYAAGVQIGSVKEDLVSATRRPIAVFDSGLGGLSVVHHLREVLPAEEVVYFGDTARVPYGSKSRRTVAKFALEAARFLLQFDPKLMVAACNTASALALEELTAALPLPVIGVVEPGARAAVQHAGEGPIAVIGTEATIASEAYPAAIRALAQQLEVISAACPLFVPLVEEGREPDDALVQYVVRDYLEPLRRRGVKAVVLACTHYPLLRPAIAAFLGPDTYIVDCGLETSLSVRAALGQSAERLSGGQAAGSMRCYVSDNPARFRRVGSRFLGQPIESVEFVEPERYVSSPALES